MKYAIFSDVDGTIFTNAKKYHVDTKKSIDYAKSKNVHFIICTGNPFYSHMKRLATELEVDYFVGSNGAVIFDVRNQNFLNLDEISIVEAQKLLDIANELELGADWWDHDNIYINEHAPVELKNHLINYFEVEPILTNVITNKVQKIEYYSYDIKKMDRAEELLKNEGLQIARMKPHHMEITRKNVSKGDAVKWLSNHLNVELNNVMTIGDSPNDHSMFKITQFSYAMANSDELTKKVANYHTSSVEQNGLGEAITDFLFRKRLTDNFKNQK